MKYAQLKPLEMCDLSAKGNNRNCIIGTVKKISSDFVKAWSIAMSRLREKHTRQRIVCESHSDNLHFKYSVRERAQRKQKSRKKTSIYKISFMNKKYFQIQIWIKNNNENDINIERNEKKRYFVKPNTNNKSRPYCLRSQSLYVTLISSVVFENEYFFSIKIVYQENCESEILIWSNIKQCMTKPCTHTQCYYTVNNTINTFICFYLLFAIQNDTQSVLRTQTLLRTHTEIFGVPTDQMGSKENHIISISASFNVLQGIEQHHTVRCVKHSNDLPAQTIRNPSNTARQCLAVYSFPVATRIVIGQIKWMNQWQHHQ